MKTQLTFVVGSLLMLVLPAVAQPTPLAAVNSPATEQDPWLSPDGYTLFFASNRAGGDFDIYQSQWNGREWSQPEALGSHVNSEFDDSQPSVSDDGRRLLFVSHRGRFYRGVWICQRQPDGSWGQAQYLTIDEQPVVHNAVIGQDGLTVLYRRVGKGHSATNRQWDMRMAYNPRQGFWEPSRPYDGPLPTNDVPGARWRFSVKDGDIYVEPTTEGEPKETGAPEVLNCLKTSSLYGAGDEDYWVSEGQNLVDGLDDTSWISKEGMPVDRQWVLLALNGRAKYVPGLSRIHRLRIHSGPAGEHKNDERKNPVVVFDGTKGPAARPTKLRILGGMQVDSLKELAVARLDLNSGSPWHDVPLKEPTYLRYIRIEVLETAAPAADCVAFNEVEAYGAGLSARRPVHRVSTDGNNNILVDGKPFFPVYLYYARSETSLAGYGFNTTLETYDVAPDSTRLAILDRAEDTGFMVIGHVPNVDYEFERKRARNQLLALKHHPALLGYLMSDEAGHSAEIMAMDQRRSDFIHEHDPHHFTMLNDLYPTYYPRSSAFVDVFSIDPYPHIVGQPFSYQGHAVDTAYQCVQHKKPVFVVNASWGPILSPVENRLGVYLGLIHGAKGISWYAIGVRHEDDDHYASILRCTREIRRLEPVWFAPDPKPDSPLLTHSRIENPSARIDVMIKEVAGEVWLLAANCEPRQATATFSFGWGDEITIKEVMAEHPQAWSMNRQDFHTMDTWPPPVDREPVRAARPIELTFTPYGVRVFRMKPVGKIGPLHEPVGDGTQLAMVNESVIRRTAEQAKALREQGKLEDAKKTVDALWSKYGKRVSVDDLSSLMDILGQKASADEILADYGRLADEHPEAESWPKWVYKIVSALHEEKRDQEAAVWMARLIQHRPDSLWRANAEALVNPASAREGHKPWTQATRIDTKPVIDGELTEPFWQNRVRFKNTVFLDSSKNPQETEFAVAYDDQALYFAARCIEPQPTQISKRFDKDDSSVWADDCIILYLDAKLEYKGYYQLIFNVLGTKWDGAGGGGHANAGGLNAKNAERKAVVKDDAWQIEIAIPFSDLKRPVPGAGQVWGLGVQRWRQIGGALPTVWGNERGTSHDGRPECFGFLVFQ